MTRPIRDPDRAPWFTSLSTVQYEGKFTRHIEDPEFGFFPACGEDAPDGAGMTIYPPKPDGQQFSCAPCWKAVQM